MVAVIYGVHSGCLKPYILPYTDILQELQLTLEQHGLDLHRSIHMWIVFTEDLIQYYMFPIWLNP